MNISKYIGKTFPEGKTAKELGLDTSRKFVVVKDGHSTFEVGDILEFTHDYGDYWASFTRVIDGKREGIHLSYLAYLEEEDEKEYVPRAGDKVRLEGEIVIDQYGPWIKCPLRNNGGHNSWLIEDIPASLTLISRAPRTLTKAEAEKMLSEKLGEDVSIE